MIQKLAKEAQNLLGDLVEEDRRVCVETLQRVIANPKELTNVWQSDVVDYLWPAFVRLLPWVRLDVWQFDDVQRAMHARPMPEDRMDAEEVLSVLFTNRYLTPHYDLLWPK